MSNDNPYRARLAKKKKNVEEAITEAGSLQDVLLTQYRALKAAEAVLLDELEDGRDPNIIRSMVHAISQSTTAYSKLFEAAELEARLAVLEEQTKLSRSGQANGVRV